MSADWIKDSLCNNIIKRCNLSCAKCKRTVFNRVCIASTRPYQGWNSPLVRRQETNYC